MRREFDFPIVHSTVTTTGSCATVIRTRRRSTTMFIFLATLMMLIVALTRGAADPATYGTPQAHTQP